MVAASVTLPPASEFSLRRWGFRGRAAEISAANLATMGHTTGGWPGALSPMITKWII
jgi:hypothetical protein